MIWLILWSLSGIIVWGNFYYSGTKANFFNVHYLSSPFAKIGVFIISSVLGPVCFISTSTSMYANKIKPKLGLKFW